MVPSKIKQLDLRKNTPPPGGGGVSVQEYLDTFKKTGRVDIPSPDGMGVYTILMRSGGYFVPQLIWKTYVKDEYDRHSPSCLMSNQGREILWYPKGMGATYGSQGREMFPTQEAYFIAMAKMVIGFILAGRKLYTLRCGANINSLNTNGTHNHY